MYTMDIDVSLYRALANGAARVPASAPALYYKGKAFSYGTLLRSIDRLAAGLVRLGVRSGDAVTICMPNTPESVCALYAVNKIGAVAHLVHPLAPQKQLARFMEKVSSVLLITLNINLRQYAPLAAQLKLGIVSASPAQSLGALKRRLFDFANRKDIVKCGIDYARLLKKDGVAEETATPDAAVYLHSGGTSGEPKVIALSSAAVNALVAKAPHILSFMDKLEGTSMLAVLPTFHGFGLAMGVHAPLVWGAVAALMPKFSTKETIDLIERGRLNYLIGVPALYEALLKNPRFCGEKLKNVRIAFIGGDSVMPDLLERFNTRMAEGGSSARLFEGYGLTETVTVCNVNLFDAVRAGSVGKPLPGIDVRIVDDSGAEVPTGETGEIWIAGDTLMNEYLGAAEETAEAFADLDGVKYVRTGDAGCVDADGFLYFKQRIKRIIKIAGISVYPSEIEAVASSLGIEETCAVEGKSDMGKTTVELYLYTSGARPSTEQVRQTILESLGKYAVPTVVEYLETPFPRTLVGKVDVNAFLRQKKGT